MTDQDIYTREFLESSLKQADKLYQDCSIPELVEMSLSRNETRLAANGALVATTGMRTGRSPKDRYIVRDELTEKLVDWGVVNQPFSPADFDRLWLRALKGLAGNRLFVSQLQSGAASGHSLSLKVITEQAWHQLFARHLFIRPESAETDVAPQQQWTLLNLPSLATDPEQDHTHSDGVVIINFTRRCLLLLGMRYAGEMKKGIFSVMNFLLPQKGVLPMHCSANVGQAGDTMLFFGLSGTGKTTLSADTERLLIGDDEHGWDDHGIFNLEGGCYAKCVDLSRQREPVIWDAIRFGAILENVVLDRSSREPDYGDRSLTENTRVAYPRQFIPLRVPENRAGHPAALIFLTCDLFGVLPPVALLDREQAAYHFLSGYTALVGGTEVGQKELVRTTFSTCFGAPFFPLPAQVYADLLMARIDQLQVPVYLVSTGWIGGAYGEGGERIGIDETRAVIHAIQQGALNAQDTEILPGLNLRIPKNLAGVDSAMLNPRNYWPDRMAYDARCRQLIGLFQENFRRFDVSDNIRAAGPVMPDG